MNETQKQMVTRLRTEGLGYKAISTSTGIPVTTIKSFCQRNNVNHTETEKPLNGSFFCKNCGSPISRIPGKKPKQFCSRTCGLTWWHNHPEQLNRKALYTFVCIGCGKSFDSYGNSHRKYCSITCFANSRSKNNAT